MLFPFDPFDTTFDRFERRPGLLAMDAVKTEDEVIVYFDAPGFDIDDVELTVEKGSITVEATRRWNDPSVKTLTSERSQGVFRRQLQVGDTLDTDVVKARLVNGVLTLAIPIREGTKPRSVEIDHADSSRSLTAS